MKSNLKWMRLKRGLRRAVVFSVSCSSDGQYNEPLIEVLICFNSDNRLKMQRKLKRPMSSPQIKFAKKLKLITYKSSNSPYFLCCFYSTSNGFGDLGTFLFSQGFLSPIRLNLYVYWCFYYFPGKPWILLHFMWLWFFLLCLAAFWSHHYPQFSSVFLVLTWG